jgi:NAD(P)-dependent dehydrogenase (short-subunit alcohol dehydrogenase family)
VNLADRFAGRTAIVTGGASGLGKAVAARIVAEGGQVLLWDVDAAALHAAKDEIGQVSVRAIDVSDQMAVAGATAEARNTLGGQIDILINAAGIVGVAAPVDHYPIDSWLRVIDVNLNGTFYCCRAVVPYMMARGYGRIVNVASVVGTEGNPEASAYAASKAGVVGFTKALAIGLAAKGIVANAITPAMLDEPMGGPDEVSNAVAMVCSMASEACDLAG